MFPDIKSYFNIHAENKEFIVPDTLESMENQLSERSLRIHKSFITNLDRIKSIGAEKYFFMSMKFLLEKVTEQVLCIN